MTDLRQALARKSGERCWDCGAKPKPGYRRCELCRLKHNAREAARWRRSKGKAPKPTKKVAAR